MRTALLWLTACLEGEWQSPDSLDLMVQRAERVTLGEGQRRTMTLQLTRR